MAKKKSKKAQGEPSKEPEAEIALEKRTGVEDMRILDELKKSYLNYAMSVIVSRAHLSCDERFESWAA
jgi:hypothetical protein